MTQRDKECLHLKQRTLNLRENFREVINFEEQVDDLFQRINSQGIRRDSESELEDKYLHMIEQLKQEAEKQIAALKLENELLRNESTNYSPISSRRSSNADSING